MTPNHRSSPLADNINENVAGALAYSLGFLTGLLIYILYPDSKFVRFHAAQSIAVFTTIVALSFIFDIAGIVFAVVPVFGAVLIELIGIFQLGLGGTALVLWFVLMFKAYEGEKYELPILGQVANERA